MLVFFFFNFTLHFLKYAKTFQLLSNTERNNNTNRPHEMFTKIGFPQVYTFFVWHHTEQNLRNLQNLIPDIISPKFK